jgi:transcription termination/antitermination protein NusG
MSAKWYIVHAYSNFEKKVAEQIKETADQKGLGDKIEQVLVPTEEITEVVRGRKRVTERRFYPGYVLVKMEMDDATYHLIKDTPKVTGFLGADGGKKPTPVSEREVQRILGVVEEGAERPKVTISFDMGEKVKVVDGPFASFEGHVEEIDEARSRLKVAVSIFGRATPVELEYAQVQKLNG